MDPKLLGQRIKEARLAKKMTQAEVVGSFITRNMLSQIESGSAVPSMKTLSYLAQVLELPPNILLPETGDSSSDSAEQNENNVFSSASLPSEVSMFYHAKEAYSVEDDSSAYEALTSLPEDFVLFDETQALLARVAFRLASSFYEAENYANTLEYAKCAATAASKGLYASPEVKSRALLLLSDAAAKLAQM